MQQIKAQHISVGSGYEVGQSLVVYEQNSALKRVQTGGDKQKFTISTWLKPAEHNSQTAYGDSIFTAGNEGSNGGRTDFFRILPTDVGGKHLRLYLAAPGAVAGDIRTKGVFNDQSAWIHAVAIIDSNNNNPLDRMQIWVNGLRQEVDISVQLTQGYSAMFFNNEGEQSLIANYAYFWQSSNTTSQPEQLRGYIAETYLIDGQALGSENFALKDDSGVYNPIPYTGTYGTNGFYLPFEESVPVTEFKTPGNHSYTVPAGVNALDLLVVGGGGGGGYGDAGGGGGAGGLEYHENVSVTPGQVIPLTVGAGGYHASPSGPRATNGGTTSILSYSVIGGGGGGDGQGTPEQKDGFDGACGGGCGPGGKNDPSTPGVGSMGGDGGPDRTAYVPPSNDNRSCGGTGGGGMGGDGTIQKNNPYPADITTCSGLGGPGVYYGDKFSDSFGDNGWFCSGGSGGGHVNSNNAPLAYYGGGGGGNNSNYGGDRSGDKIDGTGGGALGNNQNFVPGPDDNNGASGVILIKPSDADISSIGSDHSGNGNDFTPYGFNSDSVVADSPSNNYCTINPAASFVNSDCGGVLSEGNLNFYGYDGSGNGYPDTYGTFPFSSGKWYFEIDAKSLLSGAYFGMVDPSTIVDSTYPMNHVGCVSWNPAESGGFIRVDGVDTPYGVKASDGDILGIAIDVDGQTFEGFINGTGYGKFDISSAAVGSGLRVPMIVLFGDAGTGGEVLLNFGQRSWAHEPPSGYLPLCTQNLPDTLVNPKENFSAVTYTGAGGTYSLTGVGFKPSLVWTKMRSSVERHNIADSVRGPNKSLTSHDTAAEMVDAADGYFTSFDNDGWTGPGDKSATTGNNSTYISWNFRGGDTEEYNYDGSIMSRVTANKDMGFSVVKWTPNGQITTQGHGLGQVPSLIICKKISTGGDPWITWADGFSSDEYILLNTSGAKEIYSGFWGSTPNSTTFSVTGNSFSAGTAIAYCFANTEMLQVGSFTGNNDAEDNTFVSLPFKPAFLLVKNIDVIGQNWTIWDNARDPYNVSSHVLEPNDTRAEQSNVNTSVDLYSNGFKPKNNNSQCGGAGNFLYLAISDQNFKHARGR